MSTAKVIQSGDHQVVELPPGIHLAGDIVEVRQTGDTVLLLPVPKPWKELVNSLSQFSEDFMEQGRTQPPQRERADLFQ